jgi:Glutamine amidotransferase class-I
MSGTTLLIDNYDSFTWNVYQSLAKLGAKLTVVRNDKITLQDAIDINPSKLVISPGPGRWTNSRTSERRKDEQRLDIALCWKDSHSWRFFNLTQSVSENSVCTSYSAGL